MKTIEKMDATWGKQRNEEYADWLGKPTVSRLKKEVKTCGVRYRFSGTPLTVDEMFFLLISELVSKLGKDWKKFSISRIGLFHGEGMLAKLVLPNGEEIETLIEAKVFFDGEFHWDKTTIKTFGRLISKPFYQYCKLTTP